MQAALKARVITYIKQNYDSERQDRLLIALDAYDGDDKKEVGYERNEQSRRQESQDFPG